MVTHGRSTSGVSATSGTSTGTICGAVMLPSMPRPPWPVATPRPRFARDAQPPSPLPEQGAPVTPRALSGRPYGGRSSLSRPSGHSGPNYAGDVGTSTALLTDRYELTMLSAALRDGTAERRCVFEVFARRLPPGRRYGVVAGTGRLIEAIADFRFGEAEIDYLRAHGVVDAAPASWRSRYRFTGDIHGYADGELYYPGSPILTVSGTFAECVLLETLVLSVLNYDSAVAAAAARMVTAARGRPLIEMGSRRAHERAAVAAARAAYLAGFAATSKIGR